MCGTLLTRTLRRGVYHEDRVHDQSASLPGCDYVARAESEDELMQKAAQHAREAHGMQTVPADLVQQIKSKIRDE